MNNNRGTPKTLDGAITNGIAENNVRAHVADFLAQRFGVAMFAAKNAEESAKLSELFALITKRDKNESNKETGTTQCGSIYVGGCF